MKNLIHLFDLTDKIAIVTGASYGLGVTFAQALADAGARLVLAARSSDKLQEVSRRITDAGGTVLALACDISDPAQVKAMVAGTVEHFGRVDILVNNAAVLPGGGIMPERIPNEVFEQTVHINLLGTWYCCQEVGKAMLRDGKGGSIINISSIAGLIGWPDFPPAYQATKAGIISLTRSLAVSWANRRVRVNAIAPGWFPSEMSAKWLAIPAVLEWIKKITPMGRVGDPKELVGPLLFLASDASSFITGHTLVVDGGVTSGVTRCPDEVYELLADSMPGDMGKPIRPS